MNIPDRINALREKLDATCRQADRDEDFFAQAKRQAMMPIDSVLLKSSGAAPQCPAHQSSPLQSGHLPPHPTSSAATLPAQPGCSDAQPPSPGHLLTKANEISDSIRQIEGVISALREITEKNLMAATGIRSFTNKHGYDCNMTIQSQVIENSVKGILNEIGALSVCLCRIREARHSMKRELSSLYFAIHNIGDIPCV